MAKKYKIHPAIGIARLGTSQTSFYFAPETSGGLPTEIVNGIEQPVQNFRDETQQLKRQAARFRIFEYDDLNPDGRGRPITLDSGVIADIEWTVYVANKKAIWYQFLELEGEHGYSPNHPLRNGSITDPEARQKFIIDPGPQTIHGANARAEFAQGAGQAGYPQTFPPANLQPFAITSLGEIQTNTQGQLLVLGGFGRSGSSSTPVEINDYANNDGWFDDISDGSVSAVVTLTDGTEIQVDAPAWVIVAPPDFAPQVLNLVTLYDVLLDLAIRAFGYNPHIFQDGVWNQTYQPNYLLEIEPILKRAAPYKWLVAQIPDFVHLFDFACLSDPDPKNNPARQQIFNLIRPPETPNQGQDNHQHWLMPLLAGDNPITSRYESKYLTLTQTQYFLLKQWAAGNFVNNDTTNEPSLPGELLDRAALEHCVGGAFCPGIEVGWIARNKDIYTEPFRIKHKQLSGSGLSLGENVQQGLEPGDLTKRMALPWQSDFYECSDQTIDNHTVYWWPAQRPMQVQTSSFATASWTSTFPVQPDGSYVDELQMVNRWQNQGFIVNQGTPEEPYFIEIESIEDDG